MVDLIICFTKCDLGTSGIIEESEFNKRTVVIFVLAYSNIYAFSIQVGAAYFFGTYAKNWLPPSPNPLPSSFL